VNIVNIVGVLIDVSHTINRALNMQEHYTLRQNLEVTRLSELSNKNHEEVSQDKHLLTTAEESVIYRKID